MRIVLNTIKYLTISLFLIFILWTGILVIEEKFSLSKYPNVFGYMLLQVKTASMNPTIKGNDYILVFKTNDFKPNDIITYDDNGNYVTHRLISISDDSFETKGDANNTSELIDSNKAFAKVVLYGNDFTKIITVLRNPLFLFLLIIIGIVIPELGLAKIAKKALL